MPLLDVLWQLIAVAFLVTLAMLFVLRPVARAVGLMDKPGGHKTHSGQIPVIGGIAIYIGVFFASVTGPDLTHNAIVILSMGGLMVMVGVVDDLFNLRPSVRLVAHLAAAVVLVVGTGYVVESFGSILGFVRFDLGVLAAPFTILACVALVNACNMLDGMDGLAGGAAVVAFGALAVIAVSSGVLGPLIVCAAFVGALLSFLIFNLPAHYNRPLRTFMGDAGSTMVGFALSAVALVLVQPEKGGMPPAYVLWFVPIPIFELFSSTARRLLDGRSPLFADNGHFHHRLLEAGFSVRLVFALYFLSSAACAAFGLWAYFAAVADWVVFTGFVGAFAGWVLFVRRSPAIAQFLPLKLRRELDNLHV